MRRVSFSQTGWSGDLASRLDWVMSSSRELMAWPAWDFCPVVQQLAWLFSSPACFTRVSTLATCQSQVSCESQPRVFASLHNLEHIFTLSHSLPLHDSHLNIGLLIAKIQANLVRNKANKMVNKIQPYNITCIKSFIAYLKNGLKILTVTTVCLIPKSNCRIQRYYRIKFSQSACL